MITIMFADGYELASFEVCVRIAWKKLHFEKDWSEYKYGAEFISLGKDDQEKLDTLLSACVLEENSEDPTVPIFQDPKGLVHRSV